MNSLPISLSGLCEHCGLCEEPTRRFHVEYGKRPLEGPKVTTIVFRAKDAKTAKNAKKPNGLGFSSGIRPPFPLRPWRSLRPWRETNTPSRVEYDKYTRADYQMSRQAYFSQRTPKPQRAQKKRNGLASAFPTFLQFP